MSNRAEAERLCPHVSRETWDRLEVFVALLGKWQRTINLVSGRSLDEVWTRHIADGLQLVELVPNVRSWLDLGSGAGFPGLVIAAAVADHEDASVELVESDQRKCAFLREAARAIGVNARVHNGRIESVLAGGNFAPDAVTARALAPLPDLLKLAEPVLKGGTKGLFPKGRGYQQEIEAAQQNWSFACRAEASRTDPEARLLVVSAVHPR